MARRLHPELRARLDLALAGNQYFPSRKIDSCIQSIAIVLDQMKIREHGENNHGTEVGWIQSILGADVAGGDGQPWCMSLVQCVIAYIEDSFNKPSLVPASEHCLTVARGAYKIPGLITHVAEPGSFWIAQHNDSEQGHTGIVTSVDIRNGRMVTFEGNTSDQSIRDGGLACFRERNMQQNGNLKTLLFVRTYPYNILPQEIP